MSGRSKLPSLAASSASYSSHPGRAAFERDEVARRPACDRGRSITIQVIGVHTQHLAAAVIHEVHEIIRVEPIVHRHDDCADLRNRVELLKMLMRVRRDGADSIAVAARRVPRNAADQRSQRSPNCA